jgi:hypothetical protein
MTRDDAIAKLISVRHYCFVRGVLGRLGGGDDFRQAFRTANRLYVALRDGIALKAMCSTGRRGATPRKAAA